jgi:hypothetical protein
MWHAWKKREEHTTFWWGNLSERDHFEYLSVGGTIILKCIFKRWDCEAWTGLIRFRIGRVGEQL